MVPNSRTRYKQAAYEQAIALRKRGFTYTEIAKICTVSRGTVSAWLANEPFSQRIAKENTARAAADNRERIALVNKARRSERKAQYATITKLAETEYKHYRHSPLFIAGLMVYISDGNHKHPGVVRLSSSRTELHQVFIKFAINFLGVEKKQIRFWLLLYPTQNEVECMKHWIKKTRLSAGQFYKNQVIQGKVSKGTLQFGVGNTIIASTLLKRKLLRWSELVQKELQK